ncbi:hypothetical protein WJX72_008532 [[Myrmecia] bisecta]|uniref:Histone deacetylase domain-containing protein n=1 Tax=[Myrmecia] bisecta TaxID=41462 RepID=A0AAW1QB35_9CHLO
MNGDSEPQSPESGPEGLTSLSGDPDASASEEPSLAPEGWLDAADVDAEGRWISHDDVQALNAWGSLDGHPFEQAFAEERIPDLLSPPAERQQKSSDTASSDGFGMADVVVGPAGHAVGGRSGSETLLTEPASDGEASSDDEHSRDDGLAGPYSQDDIEVPEDVAKALGTANLHQLARAPSGGLDESDHERNAAGEESGSESEDGDWPARDGHPSTSSGSADYGSSDEEFSMRYCTNCTSAVDGNLCMDCGHRPDDDQALFDAAGPMSRNDSGELLSQGAPSTSGRQLPSSQSTLLAWDERMMLHEEGKHSPHPERPDRIRAVIARLLSSGLAERCTRIPCREATREEVTACHRGHLMDAVASLSAKAASPDEEGTGGPAYFTSDTYVNAHTYQCARLAAGGCVDVATAVARGEASCGAAIVRPPGHHAESGMAMGFCFFNNAGIAARAAQAAGARRVLIMDWDVHHGNGTQHIFEDDPSVLYMSIHRYDGGHFYPGTGAVDEVGVGDGEGYTVNVPWAMGGMGNGDYIAAFNHVILPIAYEFRPDIIIVSAGFDAAAGDPIGGCRLTKEAFGHMTALLGAVAPLAVLLEGGYNLSALAACSEATLRVLCGERPAPLPGSCAPSTMGMMAVQEAVRTQARYWKCLKGLVQRPPFNPYSTPYSLAPGQRHPQLPNPGDADPGGGH